MKTLCSLVLALTLSLTCMGQAGPQCKKPTPTPTPIPTPTPKPTPNPVTTTSVSSSSNASSTSSSTASSTSNATGGNATATGGNASGGTASASNGAQSNNQVTNDNQVRQAPPASAPLILPTANCLGGISAGASAGVGGLSFGSSKVDKECRMQALANEFIGYGNYEAAAKVLCATKSAKAANLTLEDCRMVAKPQPVVEVAPVIPIVMAPLVINLTPAPVTVVSHPVHAVLPAKRVVRKPAPKKPCPEK